MTQIKGIKSLMIRSGASVWGRVSRRTGKVLVQDKQASQISDDILDDIGELVLKNQGEVFVIPARDMPTNEPLAAILQPKPIAS